MCQRAKRSKMVGLCGSGGGMRKYMCYMVGTGTKFGEKWTENGAVDGDVAARGRMSGWKTGCTGARCPSLTGRMFGLCIRGRTGWTLRGEVKSGQNLEEFVNGNWRKMDGKLDPLKTKQIHRSKPTKSQHTNKSQKTIGAIFGGEFLN